MRPHVVVFLEIPAEVARSRGVIVPEVHGHVGKGGRRDEFAGRAVRYRGAGNAFAAFDEGVVDGEGSAEAGALCAADVDWG